MQLPSLEETKERAVELDPLSLAVLTDAGAVHAFAREYGRAGELFRAALALQPDDGVDDGVPDDLYGLRAIAR